MPSWREGFAEMRPDFVIVGAAKAGTTALALFLGDHPGIFMSQPKETQFFSRDFNRGVAWYERFFDGAREDQVRGEASPQYSRNPDIPNVPQRMAAVLGDSKVIYLVRDPIERIQSHYAHWVDLGQESRPIGSAIRENPVFLNASRYWHQISCYREYFTDDRILVLASEELRVAPEQTYRQTCVFLGVDAELRPDSVGRQVHVGGVTRSRPGPWLGPARELLRRSNVAPLVPAGLKSKAHRLGRRPLEAKDLHLDSEDTDYLRRDLSPDVARLAAWLGPAAPAWASRY